MTPSLLVISLVGALLLRIRRNYAKGIVDSSTSYWELVDVFRRRSWDESRKSERRRAANKRAHSLERFFLFLGVALVVLGVVGFFGLIPHTRSP